VDGRDAGVTPAALTDLQPGKHLVQVGAAEEELDLKPGGVTRLEVTATP